MEPLTMALIASAVSAGLPYAKSLGEWAWEGGKEFTGWGLPDSPDLSRELARMAGLEKEEDEFYANQIAALNAAGGRATGGALAAGGGSGIMGFNPVMGAQARQGEMQTMSGINELRAQHLAARQARELSRRQAADQTAESIMETTASSPGRRNRLRAMAEGYGAGTPEYDRLMAQATMLG